MRSHRLLISLLAVLFVTGFGCERLNAASADDAAELRARIIEWYTREASDGKTITGYLRAMRPDGSWPDIDYTSRERGSWPTHRHLTRLLAMTAAYNQADHPLAGNAELGTAREKKRGHSTFSASPRRTETASEEKVECPLFFSPGPRKTTSTRTGGIPRSASRRSWRRF